MKKEIIIILFIIVTISVLHAITQTSSSNIFESISSELTDIEDKIVVDDVNTDDVNKSIDELQDKWREKYDLYACFIEHDELEKVSTQLISISTNIRIKNYDRSVDEIEKCKFILRHIQDKDSLKFVNIF